MDGSDDLAGIDLVITSYGFLTRTPWFSTMAWGLLVLDEAQAIKNPAAKQTRSVKKLQAAGAHRVDRHADREPAGRSLVHFRFHQSGPPGIVEGICRIPQRSGRPAKSLRSAARSGASLHSAPPENRQEHHCRLAGQDRGQCFLSR